MELLLSIPGGAKVVERYGNGGFFVSGVRHEGGLLVLRDAVAPWDGTLTEDALAAVFDRQPPIDVLLIGCGPRMVLLPQAFRRAFKARGVVVEPMDTGAACRTYNVMLSEDRRVAAALIAVYLFLFKFHSY